MGAPTGNYSRNMFSEVKNYIERRVQQGIPWIDADDNDVQDAHYHLMRRIQEILGDGAVGDGFLCTPNGNPNDFAILGGDGTADGAGRFWLNGHRAHIFGATNYQNTGSTEDDKSIHPRITALQYDSGPNQSLLNDSAANWGINEHAGKTITPDITQPGSTFSVISNTATQMTIDGDVTTVAQVGDHYRIELTDVVTPLRTDGVFLNVYIDEYDCTDDPNLEHNLTTTVCAQLRLKIIQTLYVQEGAETFTDYVDADGNQHYVFEIARLNRSTGPNITDITDLRPIINDGNTTYANLYILNNNLRAVPTDPNANTLDVLPGWWTLSDRSALKKFPTQTTSPTFDPIVTPGNVRYDLISLADNSTLSIVQGLEIAGPGDPFLDGPAPEGNKLALAFVRITEDTTVVIDEEDITDAREFLNIGLGTDALASYYAALWLRPHEQDTPDDTVKLEPGRYINSDRSSAINKPSAFSSPALDPVVTPGNVRFDLVMMDDSGNATITKGTEVAGPGDPFTDAPSLDGDKLLVAIVKVDETTTVVVNDADITDTREFLNSGGALGTKVTQSELDTYRPHAQTTADNTIRIEAGQHIKSDGTEAVIVSSAFNSGTFAPVGAGLERYDLVTIDDAGAPQITAGTPVAISTGNPLTDSPSIPLDELAIAVVKVDENTTVVVDSADITDIREFLNKGGGLQVEEDAVPLGNANVMNFTGAGASVTVASGVATVNVTGGGGGGGATQLYEKHVATAGQIVFTLTTGSYVVGSDTLMVFRNGKKLVKLTEYAETDETTVTLANPATIDDVIEFIVPAAGAGQGECYKRDDFVATAGQFVFATSNTAPPSNANTMVLSGGVLMVAGVTDDYTFIGDNVVFNTPRVAGEKIAVIKVICGSGASGDCCGGLLDYEKQVATAGQTVFDLSFAYVTGTNRLVVLVNGVKQILSTDYNETDDDTITFLSGLASGDIVEFQYLGSAVCPDPVCPAPTMYERQIASANQTVFNLTQTYDAGKDLLWVFVNGVRQTATVDFDETDASTVTFLSGRLAGDEVIFIQMGQSGDQVVTAREEAIATAGQTVFNLAFTYVPGSNDLFVWAGGVLMQPGASADYLETDANTITFNSGRPSGERVVIARIGNNIVDAMRLWEKHVATIGQSVFNLAGSYTPGSHALQVFRNGQLLTVTDEYVETDSQTITLNGFVASANDVFIFMIPGGDYVGCQERGLLSYERQVATPNQTVFNLGFNFIVGSHGLVVTRNGNVQTVGVDYTETAQSQVTFTTGLLSGDQVEFRNFVKSSNTAGVLAWHLFPTVTIGQTVFNTPFRYTPNAHSLVVERNGQYQVVGIDYTEDNPQQITLITPIAATTEEIVVYTIASAAAGSRAHDMAFHDDAVQILAAGQTYRNLVVQTLDAKTVAINPDAALLMDDWVTGVTTTPVAIDITTSGVNGLDAGSEASDTWYYIYVIYNPSTQTVAGLLSVSATSPVLPSGYTKKRLVGAVRNDGSSDFWQFYQTGNHVQYLARHALLLSGSSTSFTPVSIAGAVPTTLGIVGINYSMRNTANIDTSPNARLSLDGTNDIAWCQLHVDPGGTGSSITMQVYLGNNASNQIWYFVTIASDDFDLYVIGYHLDL